MRFYTSDLHLGHANVLKYCGRPWGDVEAMNAGLLQRWNAVVGTEDEVYILGDLTLKNPAPNGQPAQWLADWLAAANGTKVLIVGNHDRAWKAALSALRHGDLEPFRRWRGLYSELGITETVSWGFMPDDTHGGLTMSHLPMTRTAHESVSEAEYVTMVPEDGRGDLWRLHGHVHTQWQQNGREIHVGVDAWNGTPVAEDIIESIINMGPMNLPARMWTNDEDTRQLRAAQKATMQRGN